jgi:YD repeat-containing protein
MKSVSKSLAALLAAASSFTVAVQAHAQDFRDNFPQQYTDTPMGVNLQSGRFSYWLFSFAMGPFVTERGFNKGGFPFVGSIYWTSRMTASGASQEELMVNLGNRAVSLGNPVELVQHNIRPVGNSWLRGSGSTRLAFYYSVSQSKYLPTMGDAAAQSWTIVRNTAGFTLTDKSGNQYYFADATSSGGYGTPNGRLSTLTDADGSKTSFTYDASGRLSFMESNKGYAVRYEYLSGGAQMKVCGFNLAQTYTTASTSCSASSYVVTINNTVRTDGLLQPTSVVDLMGQTSTINWGGYNNNFPVCMTLPNSPTCEFNNSYGPQGSELPQLTKKDQVRVQTDANGSTYNYGYDFPLTNSEDPPKQPGGPPIQSTAWVNGPGYSAQVYYEDGLAKTVAAPGGGPTSFEYNGVELWKATWPEGNKLQIDRDPVYGNPGTTTESPKTGDTSAPLVSNQTFSCTPATMKYCTKPITRVDAKGNQIDFTYDPAHGGVLTKTLPAVQVDATGPLIRPQTRYEYAQRYAWIKNASGAYVQASSPVWVLLRERSCRKTAASGQTCAGGAADEVITDYDYGPNSGPNNLLLRGVAVTVDGQTLRTCYTYDANGRKLSETQPKAGLAVCP